MARPQNLLLSIILGSCQYRTSSLLLPTSTRTSRRFLSSSTAIMASCPPKCEPCSGLDDSALLSVDVVNERLVSLPLWQLKTDPAPSLSRHYVCKNFQCALDSINQMGVIAEREFHHPNFHLVNYREVEIHLWTHKLNGVTENDLILAEMLDKEVDVVYSPKWLKEHPEAEASTTSTS